MQSPHLAALAGAEPYPYWFEHASRPDANDTLVATERCDLCVVGGGYTGLWAAILAKERDPDLDIVLIDADTCGTAASGRNGGFVEASLTHGVANGLRRFPHELRHLERLGRTNLDALEATLARYDIDCGWERNGVIDLATDAQQARALAADYQQLRQLGQSARLLDREAIQAEVHSASYTAGLWRTDSAAIVDPARLVWGLKGVAERLGVRIYEHTAATDLDHDGLGVLVTTPLARIRAEKVALATNAAPPLLRRLRYYVVPVYDYCMATEPLTDDQMASIGWNGRQGLSDTGNQFHYYRLTEDNRIVWGGFDAIYYFGSGHNPTLESRPETWAKLSEHFFATFPQLTGLNWSHVWGGAIDTCTRFTVFWGKALRGKVAYALGYTGLGVAATRFGAEVMLDLLDGRHTERTALEFVRTKPAPWPPEPFRYLGIQATRWSLDREDRTGERNLWLKALDRIGLGFDS